MTAVLAIVFVCTHGLMAPWWVWSTAAFVDVSIVIWDMQSELDREREEK